jgi:ASPIC and UnbV
MVINLVGTSSNRSAVGSRIKIKTGGKTYIREVRAGESYGISNSLMQSIGLGINTSIESLEIAWTSGLKTSIQNPIIDQFLTIVEPTCAATCITITAKIIK